MLRGLPEERLKALSLQRDRRYVLLNSDGELDPSEKSWEQQFEEPFRAFFVSFSICFHAF